MAATAADLVGRDEELSTIARFLEAGAPPRAAVVEGEAGIGKTTVWQAAVEAARGRGFRTLEARPGESEAKLVFSSLADLLGGAADETLTQLPPPQRRALEAALLLDDAGGRRVDRRAVAAGLLASLRALSAERPLLLAIDDIQWLDGSSTEALEFAVRRLGEEPVALLLARRLGDADGSPAIEQTLPSERVLSVSLRPLDFVTLNAVLHDRLGAVLPRPLLHRIHELSGGNPFFALELARAPEWIEPGRGLPPSLDVLVRGRVSSLPRQARRALLAAAAAAEPTVDLVDAAVRAPDALAPAEAAHIVALEHGNVRFDHPLLSSAAYAAAAPAERRAMHRRLGSLVRDPEERARHLAAAATGPGQAVAAALEEAAARARARGAPAAAAELSEEAAQLTPAADAAAARRRAADAGYYHFESGDSRQALALLEELAGKLAPGRERADVLIRLARVRSYSDDVQAATELFLQAADEAGDERRARARALEGAATQLFRRRTDLESAVEYAKASAALARELGDEALVGEALGSQLLAEATLGRPEAAATLDQAVDHQEAAQSERILAQPKWTAAIARMWWDEPGAVRQTYEELVERGREVADEGSLAYVHVMLAQADILLGDFERAGREAVAAREIAEQAGQEALVAYARAAQAMSDAHRGRAGAREEAAAALELGRRTQVTPAVHFATAALGLLELSTGRPEEAAARLSPLTEFARAERICEPSLTRYVVDHVEALVELGRLDEAGALLDWYEANAETLGRRSALAAAGRSRALLVSAAGRVDESLPIFEQALREHDAVPSPFDRARTQLSFGAALRRARRKADARSVLEDAAAAFEALDALAFAERARSELARIGGRRPTRSGELTATEQQIAELVADGKSNKEVAAALFVTVKTVEAHLSRVYAKLGIHSRAALARHLSAEEPAGKP